MSTLKNYQAQIDDWEYCYCPKCDSIRYSTEMEATEKGVRCSVCGSFDLEAPDWVRCPNEMRGTAVKCPRGGRGIKVRPEGSECLFHCIFRKP